MKDCGLCRMIGVDTEEAALHRVEFHVQDGAGEGACRKIHGRDCD